MNNVSFCRKDFEFDRAVHREWLLTNGLGGYASSTIIGLNTRKYHGLLVSSDEKLNRTVVLQKLEEEVRLGGESIPLSVNEYRDGTIYPKGNLLLSEFSCSPHEASFAYKAGEFMVFKTVRMPHLSNTVVVSYLINNKSEKELSFSVLPLGNVRGYHTLGSAGVYAEPSDERTIRVSSSGRRVVVHSDKAIASERPYDLNGRVLYRLERERGEDCVEDVSCWGKFSLGIGPRERTEVSIACADESSGVSFDYTVRRGGSLLKSILLSRLEDHSRSFVVYTPPWRTVVAGYPWFSEWSRDALVSLPGLTLVWRRMEDAESILRRFFFLYRGGRLPTNTEGGKVVYGDFDGALWLVDRLFQYVKYAGPARGRRLVEENARVLSEIIQSYSSLLLDGVLQHGGGTWMDTLERDNAVEMQALYYNALKAYQRLSELYCLKVPRNLDVSGIADAFGKEFLKTYWSGEFLKDTTQFQETSVRPNQLIASSLDYTMLNINQMASILSVCEKRLLTEVGVRTLEREDPRYRGAYTGCFSERESAYHNGSIWPWLLGPYVRTYVRVQGRAGRKKMKTLLERFFRRTLGEAGLGYVSELFDGDTPHTPRGCIAQAWSIAEPARAYFEDALGVKPPYEKELL